MGFNSGLKGLNKYNQSVSIVFNWPHATVVFGIFMCVGDTTCSSDCRTVNDAMIIELTYVLKWRKLVTLVF